MSGIEIGVSIGLGFAAGFLLGGWWGFWRGAMIRPGDPMSICELRGAQDYLPPLRDGGKR